MKATIGNLRNLLANLKATVNNAIAELPGEGWQATEISSSRIIVAIIDPETGRAMFGHKFEISYHPAIFDEEDSLDFNIGTMGSFDPSKDTTRIQLYMGFAKLGSDLKLQGAIKTTMRDMAEMHYEMMSNK